MQLEGVRLFYKSTRAYYANSLVLLRTAHTATQKLRRETLVVQALFHAGVFSEQPSLPAQLCLTLPGLG